MHEAGIARGIINTLGARPADWERLRIVVRGGHTNRYDFDAALRLHLRLAAPALDIRRIVIVHEPRSLTCANCGARFEAIDLTDPCPHCSGGAWPESGAEEIMLELLPGRTPVSV